MATGFQQSEQLTAADSRPLAASDRAGLRHGAAQLASLAVRLYRLRAAALCLSAGVLATMLLVAADHAIHAEEAGLRWLATCLWLAIVGGAAWKLVLPAWSFSLSPVRVAQWIERTRPDFQGRLSNALAIAELPESDLRYGSRGFRAAALDGLNEQPLVVDWRSYLDFKPTLRAAILLTIAALSAGGLCIAFPTIAQLGIQRLFNPWLAAPWPRSDQLRFVNLPRMIASGSELQVEVVDDRPPLPASLELQVRSSQSDLSAGDEQITRVAMRVLNDVAIAVVGDMRDAFSVRVVGGDDQDTPWHEIQVADLPELIEHQFHVDPPPYARQPAADLVGERIEVLAGSRVTFHGRSSGRLRGVVAVPVEPPPPARQAGAAAQTSTVPTIGTATSSTRETQWTADLSADRQAFDLFADGGGLVVDHDLRWRFHILTAEGLEVDDTRTWSVHAVADRPPAVNLLPVEPAWVTRESTVNVIGDASDDLELVEVKMVWQSSDEVDSHSRSLWPESAERDSTAGGNVQRSVNLRFQWHPGEESLPADQPIALYLEARDSAGQVTRSIAQTLQIRDPEAVLAQIQAEEAKTFGPLRQLLETQRRNQQAVQRTRDILNATQTLEAGQLEALSSARQVEQSIAEQLARSPSSVLRTLQSLSEQLQRNGLEDSDGAKHIANLATEIERLNEQAIEPAAEQLETAQASLRTALDKPSPSASEVSAAASQVEKAAARQQHAAERLAGLVDSIATAERAAELRKEFSELLARQNQIRSETERLQVERVLDPKLRASEAQQVGLRSDQQSLARTVDDLVSAIDRHLQNAADADRPALQALERAREELIDQRVSAQMREAAEMVGSGQLSKGIAVQRAAAEALEKAAGKFSSSEGISLESTAVNLQHTADQLARIADAQSRLADQLHEATDRTTDAASTSRLAQQQAELAQEASQLSTELQRRADAKLSDKVKQAEQHAGASAEKASAEDYSGAADSARQAADEFGQARDVARQRAAEVENQIAAQQLLDLGTTTSELLRLQTPIVDKLRQLKQLVDADTSTRQEAEMREAAATQEAVRQRLVDVLSRHRPVEPFGWLLERCETDMTRAIAALERQRLDPDALVSAESALSKLDAASTALSDTQRGPEREAPENSADNNGQTQETRPERRPTMASLKLLRALQADINERTDKSRAEPGAASDSQLRRLSEEQEALAEQTQKILQKLKEK